jgi:hypothetical protein
MRARGGHHGIYRCPPRVVAVPNSCCALKVLDGSQESTFGETVSDSRKAAPMPGSLVGRDQELEAARQAIREVCTGLASTLLMDVPSVASPMTPPFVR